MPRTNRPSRKDTNHAEVVAALKAAGWSVSDTSAVGTRGDTGALDLFVARHGVTVLVEVKMPGKKLNDSEREFFDAWQGEKIIAFGGEDCLAKLDAIVSRLIPF